jgi:hypothetical protein
MTSLVHDTSPKIPARADLADKVGVVIAISCAILAIGLAINEIASEAPADLPSLIPLDEAHYWSGFSA